MSRGGSPQRMPAWTLGSAWPGGTQATSVPRQRSRRCWGRHSPKCGEPAAPRRRCKTAALRPLGTSSGAARVGGHLALRTRTRAPTPSRRAFPGARPLPPGRRPRRSCTSASRPSRSKCACSRSRMSRSGRPWCMGIRLCSSSLPRSRSSPSWRDARRLPLRLQWSPRRTACPHQRATSRIARSPSRRQPRWVPTPSDRRSLRSRTRLVGVSCRWARSAVTTRPRGLVGCPPWFRPSTKKTAHTTSTFANTRSLRTSRRLPMSRAPRHGRLGRSFTMRAAP
mmetsp:Transcript_57956/g.124505  ORF Transcript_57956/g.124505 Transcript_57956/m.124505 type:complete len:281 (-) Transcript_57956:161-1003(-)